MPEKVCLDILVSGTVQGVGFRAFVRAEARKHAVNGWARNLPDGRVAVRLCGDSKAVAEVESAVHTGPKWSSVNSVHRQRVNCEDVQHFTIG